LRFYSFRARGWKFRLAAATFPFFSREWYVFRFFVAPENSCDLHLLCSHAAAMCSLLNLTSLFRSLSGTHPEFLHSTHVFYWHFVAGRETHWCWLAGWKFSPNILLLLFCQCARTCLSCRRAAANSNAFASLQISIFFDRRRFECQMISRRLRAHKHFTAGYKATSEHISLAFKKRRVRKGARVTSYGEDAREYLMMMIDGPLVIWFIFSDLFLRVFFPNFRLSNIKSSAFDAVCLIIAVPTREKFIKRPTHRSQRPNLLEGLCWPWLHYIVKF